MGEEPRASLPFRKGLTFRLTGAVIGVLLLIGIPFLFAFHRLLRAGETNAMTRVTDGIGRIVADGIRSSMLAGQPHLLDETFRKLAEEPGVERVMILDHEGRVIISSEQAMEGRLLARQDEATCNSCHSGPDIPPGSRTTMTDEGGQRVFRAMSTIPNEARCHECHDPATATNGILLLDLSFDDDDQRFFAGFGTTVALGAVMALLTVAVLVLLLQRMVHRPLRTILETSQTIVRGDMEARAPLTGPGEFTQLAAGVNRMTDHLANSIRTVESQRRELQAILDAMDDEIVVLDRQRRIVAANRAFRRQRDRGDGEAAGHTCRDVADDEDSCLAEKGGNCPVRRVFESGTLQKAMVTSSGGDGSERTIEIHASPLRNQDGVVDLAVEVRRDISERRQMEAVLAHSEHMASLGLLASGLSHEINNPLGAIAASVDGLRRRLTDDPALPEETREAFGASLRRIADQVERGRSITSRLLRVARPTNATRSLIDVNHVAREMVALLSHDIRRAGVEVELDLHHSLPPLRGDEARLGQILMNLAMNALQAMADGGGTLRIATAPADGGVRLMVQDTGCGIPAALMKRIYEPFFTTKPVGKGTGLGLFITHRSVAGMGGTIDVRSEPGRGALFTLWLPRDLGGFGA